MARRGTGCLLPWGWRSKIRELRIDNGELLLIPHNPLEQEMRYPPEEVRIVGIYSGILMRQARTLA